MLVPLDDKKVVGLKDYFQSKMPEMSVDARQTDSDVDKDLVSFSFHKKGSPALEWRWCLKVMRAVLADRQLREIMGALESQRWKGRLQQAPDGSVFILTKAGLEEPSKPASG